MPRNVLAISNYFDNKSRIFEDYCVGAKNNSDGFLFIDYKELYQRIGKKQFEEHILNAVDQNNIDCVFFFLLAGDMTFDIFFIEKIGKKASVVMMFSDTHVFFESCDRYYAQLADLVILPGYLEKFKFQYLGINALSTFSLYDKRFYRNDSPQVKSIDVSFIGDTDRIGRKEKIGFLKDHGIRVETYGNNTDHGFVSFDGMIDVINRSKINLNFTGSVRNEFFLSGKNINDRVRIINGRMIEIALCGGFVLTEYAPGIENVFKIGEEIAVFESSDDLLQKIGYYLDHEQERELMAKKGYGRAIADYDSTAAFKKIFEKLDTIAGTKKQILLDDIFLISYAAFRSRYMRYFLLHGKLGYLMQEIIAFFKTAKFRSYPFFRTMYFLEMYRYRFEKMRRLSRRLWSNK